MGKRGRLLCVAAMCALPGCRDSNAPRVLPGTFQGSLQIDTLRRTFVGYAPTSRPPAGAPLVLAFHGAFGSGASFRSFAGLDAIAEREGAIVVYPDALVGNWEEGCGCNNAWRLGINDTGFTRLMIENVAARYPIDRSRIYAIGFSQGGLFAHRLACDMAGTFAAVVTVAAPMGVPVANGCAPAKGISMLTILGMSDGTFGWTGSDSGAWEVLGGVATFDRWRAIDACGTPTESQLPDADADGQRTLVWHADGCTDGAEVELDGVQLGGHGWGISGDFRTPERAMAFLMRHQRQ